MKMISIRFNRQVYMSVAYILGRQTHNHMTHSTFIGTELRLVRAKEYKKIATTAPKASSIV